jgi:large conductance mechanosensitive channel
MTSASVFLARESQSGIAAKNGNWRVQMLKEFQEFISKGNVMDLAVGVIIGAAFGKIVDSLVNDIIMPIVGAIFGGLDFNNYFLALSSAVTATSLAEAKKQGAVFAYGSFLTVVLNFLILAWIIFLMVKAVNTMRKKLETESRLQLRPRRRPTSRYSPTSATCWLRVRRNNHRFAMAAAILGTRKKSPAPCDRGFSFAVALAT